MNNNTPNLSGGVSNTAENKQISSKSKLSLGFEKERGKIASVCSAAVAALAVGMSSGCSMGDQAKSEVLLASSSTGTPETTIINFTGADETRLNELSLKMTEGSITRSEIEELMVLQNMHYNYKMAMIHAERAEIEADIAMHNEIQAGITELGNLLGIRE